MTGDVKRLPKWAQQLLHKAEADANYWKERYVTAVGVEPSNVKVGGAYRNNAFVPNEETICWMMPDGQNYIEASFADQGMDSVTIRGERNIQVHPGAANVIIVTCRR